MSAGNVSSVKIVGVIGVGTMGRGIAQLAAQAGLHVRLFDKDAAALKNAMDSIMSTWGKDVVKGRMDTTAMQRAQTRLIAVDRLAALADCDVVVEAIVEDLQIKQQLFVDLEDIVSERTLLATNTSSLSVTAVQSACRLPGRVVGWHFFNPVPRMKLAEVVQGALTDAVAVDTLMALTLTLGHKSVRAKDMPGFVVNHAGRAFIPEGLRILSEEIADAQTIDRIMKGVAGFRMGPFELADLIGLDVAQTVMESLYHQYYEEARFRLHPILGQRVAAGLLGRKSGKGFYIYEDKASLPPPSGIIASETSGAAACPARDVEIAAMPVWISPEHADLARSVVERLAGLSVPLEQGGRPSSDALILTTPIGADATSTCLALDLDPARSVAVNALFGLDNHVELMRTPATRPDAMAAARALFERSGLEVSCINDSPGFVSQRIVAQIVSIGCDIAQQGIGTPDDINLAARIALGYPAGPLDMGDRLGAERILAICDALYETYRDPRYRASVWLRRRAGLGLSLNHE